jgi:hypothetical protein
MAAYGTVMVAVTLFERGGDELSVTVNVTVKVLVAGGTGTGRNVCETTAPVPEVFADPSPHAKV